MQSATAFRGFGGPQGMFGIETVIAPAMGGLVIGQEVARQLRCRFIFAEKENGALVLRRGFKIQPGERCLVVEDVVTQGGRHPDYKEEDGQRVMKQSEITVRVVLGRGTASDTVWTCDLSHDYVSINADYRS
jgi:hypothetical protein